MPYVPKEDANNVNKIYDRLKENDYNMDDPEFSEHKPSSDLYDGDLNGYYDKVVNGDKYLIYNFSVPNLEFIKGHYDYDSDSDSEENELFNEYTKTCNNKKELSKLKGKQCYGDNYNLFPSEYIDQMEFELTHTNGFNLFPIVIGKILNNGQINFFNKQLEKIYDISSILYTKPIEYEGTTYLRAVTNKIYNTKINYDEEDDDFWIAYSQDNPEKYLNKYNCVGVYNSTSGKIDFTKGFEKEVHNKIKTVRVDNDIREASHICRNTDEPGAYLVWYKCPTCSYYHQHGIPHLNGGVSNNIGHTIERGTHCELATYGPSEVGQINVVITPDTKIEIPKIGKRKFNEFDGKEKVIRSNFCTYI